ncbi:hypothetical protein [Parapedobacter sp. DT-150]|uniref:hypothetical protein n=1 Tax=Parapedobacter sp. DT-150 TaxID=3396162 RepID=UPI003F1B91E0
MDKNDYLNRADRLYARWEGVDLWNDVDKQRHFTIFCANMRRFRPDIPWIAMPDLFRKLNVRMALAAMDQTHPAVWTANTVTGWTAEWVRGLLDRPGIVCTYHTGSYRLLCRKLIAERVPFALLVSDAVLKQQGAAFGDQYSAGFGTDGAAETLMLINAQRPNALFAIRDALRAGRQLVAYIDGNTGSGASVGTRGLVEVDFFRSTMPVRSGLAYVAQLMDVPVYPVVCTRPLTAHIRFEFPEACWTDRRLDRTAGAARTTRYLYRVLERAIRTQPEEWEGWLYLHKLPANRLKSAGVARHGRPWTRGSGSLPLPIDGHYYALDVSTWRSYPIGEKEFGQLLNIHRRRTGFG